MIYESSYLEQLKHIQKANKVSINNSQWSQLEQINVKLSEYLLGLSFLYEHCLELKDELGLIPSRDECRICNVYHETKSIYNQLQFLVTWRVNSAVWPVWVHRLVSNFN